MKVIVSATDIRWNRPPTSEEDEPMPVNSFGLEVDVDDPNDRASITCAVADDLNARYQGEVTSFTLTHLGSS